MKHVILTIIAAAACTVFAAETETVCNGDFTRMHPKNADQLLAWNIKKGKAVKEGDKVSIRLEKGGTLGQHLRDWKNSLGQADRPRAVTIRFTASGKGRAVIYMGRYSDKVVDKKRERKYLGSDRVKIFTLQEKPQEFETDYQLPANEWGSIGFNAPEGEMTVEKVSVLLR